MKGSEKQIKWAMDILDRINEDTAAKIEQCDRNIAARAAQGKPSRFVGIKAKAEKVLAAIDVVRESDISAGVIINVLCSYDSFYFHLDAHDFDVDKLIRYTI